jgi:hypothetical protein
MAKGFRASGSGRSSGGASKNRTYDLSIISAI